MLTKLSTGDGTKVTFNPVQCGGEYLCLSCLGKLVTAKYIPLEKYHKWFLVAASAKKYISPSS